MPEKINGAPGGTPEEIAFQEKAPVSFEGFKKLVEEVVSVMRRADAAQKSVNRYGEWWKGEGLYSGEPEKWEAIPEMADLREEEQSLLAAGVSSEEIERLSSLYKKAFERAEELEEKARQMVQNNEMVREIMYTINRTGHEKRLSADGIDFPEHELKEIYYEAVSAIRGETSRREAEGLEKSADFEAITALVREAEEVMGKRSSWEFAERKLKAAGYETPEALLQEAAKRFTKLKAEVGAEKFDELKRFSYHLGRVEKATDGN